MQGDNRTDPNLIRAIRDYANHEAWKTFERRYSPIIRAYCASRGMRSCDTEDVSQEVFLRISAYGFADRYDPKLGTFRSYLFRVTRSIASKYEHSKPLRSDASDPEQSVDEQWESAWRAHAIRLAVARVEESSSSTTKRVLMLTLRGVPPAVIADLLGMTRAAVYKCRDRIRSRIESACNEVMLDTHEI
jgi:RNA polymerase sigma factor (sigma-70 family)